MANDSGHSHPLFARVGNTEFVVAHLKMPVKNAGPIDAGELLNDGEITVVDLDMAEVEHLRRRLGLAATFVSADHGANVTEEMRENPSHSDDKRIGDEDASARAYPPSAADVRHPHSTFEQEHKGNKPAK